MSRFTETRTIEKYKEAVAPRVEIEWNPVTNAADIYFTVKMAVYEDGEFTSLEDDKTLEMSRMKVNFASIASRTFQVPIGGGNFAAIPAMLLMGAIKQVFDELYSEHRDVYDTPPPPPLPPIVSQTPSPTPVASPIVTPEATPAVSEPLPLPSPTPAE